jgi:hypothetical protein
MDITIQAPREAKKVSTGAWIGGYALVLDGSI